MEPEKQQLKTDQPASTQQDEPLPSTKANAQPETRSSSVEHASHSKNKLLLPLILAVALLFTILAIAGIFIFKNLNSKQTNVSSTKNQQVSTITPTKESPSPTPDSTANWKTYTNKDLAFAIRIPNDWTTFSRKGVVYVGSEKYIDNSKDISGSFCGGAVIIAKTTATTPRTILSESDDLFQVQKKDTIVSEKSAEKYEVVAKQDGPGIKTGDKTIRLIVENKGLTYHITMCMPGYESQFDQILSTFKFMD